MNKKTKIILSIIIIISLLLLIYSIVNIVIWKNDSNKTNKQIEDIQEEIKVTEVVDTENTGVCNMRLPYDCSFIRIVKL